MKISEYEKLLVSAFSRILWVSLFLKFCVNKIILSRCHIHEYKLMQRKKYKRVIRGYFLLFEFSEFPRLCPFFRKKIK